MTNVYFLGPLHSFSHILVKQAFSDAQYLLHPCTSFDEIVRNMKRGIGILPIENSITSDIYENVDAIFVNNFRFIGEGFLLIHLHLIANGKTILKNITDVYSHPKALDQCNVYIAKHRLIRHETKSTSEGKREVANKMHNALIGSESLAKENGFSIIERNIGDMKINMTRFVFVTQDPTIQHAKKGNKATILFRIAHVPGALAHTLHAVAKKSINLTKIESRPIPGTKWEYNFWIDIEKENLSEETIASVLDPVTNFYKILGIYDKGKLFES